MKKLLVLALTLLTLLALSACTQQKRGPLPQTPSAPAESQKVETQPESKPVESVVESVPNTQSKVPEASKPNTDKTSSELISKDKAVEIALKKAGLDKKSVFDLDAELDREREGVIWEVDFETREYEYSYDINAYDGTVLNSEREIKD